MELILQQNLPHQQKAIDAVCNSLDGVILTKLDGDARGGAALSVKEITGVPIKFIGVGEGIEDLEAFEPERFIGGIFDE